MKRKSIQYEDLCIGDHIRVWRGTYYHHGIFCGRNSVIHYTGEVARKKNAVIRQDFLETFLAV